MRILLFLILFLPSPLILAAQPALVTIAIQPLDSVTAQRLAVVTKGLDHCPQPGCVMRDAESSIATVDGETGKFCERCKTGWESWVKEQTD